MNAHLNSEPLPGDQVRVSILVKVPPERAFEIFTRELNQWWRQGPRYRIGPQNRGILHLEAGIGGRLYESVETSKQLKIVQTGTVTAWEPPHRLVFDWRGVNFAPDEHTEVEVLFEAHPSGTWVTVSHRGWSSLPPDHPVRHGQETSVFLRRMGFWWSDLLSALRVWAASDPNNPDFPAQSWR